MSKVIVGTFNNLAHYSIYCLACDCIHTFNETWGFNNDFSNPTVTASIKVTGVREDKDDDTKYHDFICHSFVKDGKIQYLSDCTHSMAGQTIELPQMNHRGDLIDGREGDL